MKIVETTITEKVTTRNVFNSTEGYLLVRVWELYSCPGSNWPAPAGEMEFMEDVQRACYEVNQILEKTIDWDEMDTVFDYEFADEVGPKSLAYAIFETLIADGPSDLEANVRAWLHTTDLPLIKPEEPEFRAGLGMADDVQ